MSKLCENTISKLHIDFAFLVVHADESCLSFNDSKVESGYTKVYRALLDATGKSSPLSWRKYILLTFSCSHLYTCFKEFVPLAYLCDCKLVPSFEKLVKQADFNFYL